MEESKWTLPESFKTDLDNFINAPEAEKFSEFVELQCNTLKNNVETFVKNYMIRIQTTFADMSESAIDNCIYEIECNVQRYHIETFEAIQKYMWDHQELKEFIDEQDKMFQTKYGHEFTILMNYLNATKSYRSPYFAMDEELGSNYMDNISWLLKIQFDVLKSLNNN